MLVANLGFKQHAGQPLYQQTAWVMYKLIYFDL